MDDSHKEHALRSLRQAWRQVMRGGFFPQNVLRHIDEAGGVEALDVEPELITDLMHRGAKNSLAWLLRVMEESPYGCQAYLKSEQLFEHAVETIGGLEAAIKAGIVSRRRVMALGMKIPLRTPSICGDD